MVNNTPQVKYIIDTSSILSQKDNEPHRRTINKTLWKHIDELISPYEFPCAFAISKNS